MGIVPRMITGDSTPIAEEIAKEVGIGQNVSRVSDAIRTTSEKGMASIRGAL